MTAWPIADVFTVSMLLIVDSSSASSVSAARRRPRPVWSATMKPTRAPGKQVLANEPR